jgi:5-methylcytosine-specific restriction endonuclease McrA
MSHTLLLNADASPVSMLPLSTLDWQEAIRYLVLNKVTVLEWYDDWVVHSASWETKVPAVIMLNEFHKKKTAVRYTKQNVFLRDDYICQYCGTSVSRKTATLDHVIPSSLGGTSTWENSVCACGDCNSRKSNSLKMKPKVKPLKPTYYQLVEKRKRLKWDRVPHTSWHYYLQ